MLQGAGVIEHEQPRAIAGDQRLGEPRITRQARFDIRQGLTPPRNQTLAQHGLINRQQQHQRGRIALAGLRQVRAGAVDQHVLPRRQPIVDVPGNAIAQPIGVPTERKRALGLQRGELRRAHTLRRLAHRFCRAGDHAAHNAAAALGQTGACGIQQAVLARTRWSDEIDQPACHQNTLFACRNTGGTTRRLACNRLTGGSQWKVYAAIPRQAGRRLCTAEVLSLESLFYFHAVRR